MYEKLAKPVVVSADGRLLGCPQIRPGIEPDFGREYGVGVSNRGLGHRRVSGEVVGAGQ
jgi:hypothetical protein